MESVEEEKSVMQLTMELTSLSQATLASRVVPVASGLAARQVCVAGFAWLPVRVCLIGQAEPVRAIAEGIRAKARRTVGTGTRMSISVAQAVHPPQWRRRRPSRSLCSSWNGGPSFSAAFRAPCGPPDQGCWKDAGGKVLESVVAGRGLRRHTRDLPAFGFI